MNVGSFFEFVVCVDHEFMNVGFCFGVSWTCY